MSVAHYYLPYDCRPKKTGNSQGTAIIRKIVRKGRNEFTDTNGRPIQPVSPLRTSLSGTLIWSKNHITRLKVDFVSLSKQPTGCLKLTQLFRQTHKE